MNTKKLKVCFAASSGGHFEQLLMMKPLMNKYDGIVMTEKTKFNSTTEDNYYYLIQVNRKELSFIPKMIGNLFISLKVFLKEKPDVIICTGVLATLPMCLIMKAFKKKLVYVESFAKISSPTHAGKFLYRFADRFYVQWESMLKVYPNAKYFGGIY